MKNLVRISDLTIVEVEEIFSIASELEKGSYFKEANYV